MARYHSKTLAFLLLALFILTPRAYGWVKSNIEQCDGVEKSAKDLAEVSDLLAKYQDELKAIYKEQMEVEGDLIKESNFMISSDRTLDLKKLPKKQLKEMAKKVKADHAVHKAKIKREEAKIELDARTLEANTGLKMEKNVRNTPNRSEQYAFVDNIMYPKDQNLPAVNVAVKELVSNLELKGLDHDQISIYQTKDYIKKVEDFKKKADHCSDAQLMAIVRNVKAESGQAIEARTRTAP